MVRIAVCDDMDAFQRTASEMISRWHAASDNVTVELFSDADSLIEAHGENPFDIIFLDVVMPLVSGLDAAAEIRRTDKTVKIVFLTSSAEFAVDSYAVHADGYLLKPVDEKKMCQCLDELYEDMADRAEYILIRDAVSVRRVELRKVEYVEAQGKHVNFVLTDGTTLSSLKPFYSYENVFTAQSGFLKCHRSYIVNVFQISRYTAREITMKSGCRIPISRNCQKDFETAFFELTFGKFGDA